MLFAILGWAAGRAEAAPDLEKLRARAEQADVEAQNALGSAYTEGQSGLRPDFAEANKWFHRAADKGFAPAQYNLGLAYEQGRGLPADERQAFKYYLLAAEQGYGPAQFNVGNMYAAGRGTGQDLFESNLWFKQAAEKGLVDAMFNLGLAYETGRGVRKDEAQAARWYKQAADRGFSRAQHNLGLLLEDGRGVVRNEAAAAACYRAAAEQGLAGAQSSYGRMLAEGKGGLVKDPLQAWVWLNLAVENGANPAPRDLLTRQLSAEQLAAARQLLADRKAGQVPAAALASIPARPPEAPAGSTAPEPTGPEQPPAAGGETTGLIDQLRAQSQRLAAQVQALTADKEAAAREAALLNVQLKDAQQDLAKVKGAPVVVARDDRQVADLTARLEQATVSIAQLQAANQQLTEGNARLQKEKETLAAGPAPEAASANGGNGANLIANLQRDNARLNDEVKRSTRELLSLSSQLRALRNQAAKPAAPVADDKAGAEQIAQLNAKLEQAAQEGLRWQTENSRLAARVTELENQPKPLVDNSTQVQLAEARQAAGQLQQQVAALQGEKADLEKWSRSLEQTINEKSVQAEGASTGLADLRQKLARLQKLLDDTVVENHALAARAASAEQALATRTAAKPDTTELDGLRQQLAVMQQQAEKTARDQQALADQAAEEHRGLIQAQGRVASLERDLREARKTSDHATELEDLKNQLVASNQLLEKSGATVAELTGVNDRLEKEIAAARQGAAADVALRDELAKLRAEAANAAALREENRRLGQAAGAAGDLRAKNEQLAKDIEQITAFMNGNRRDLDVAQARVADLEKQLAAAKAAGPRGGDDTRKLSVELGEANAAVEKLNATVAELTGTNDRLEKDLENARKSTEAALAAQSQAVSAAQPDAYKMEISTLQARVKELEGANEEDRNNSAKEVATLAAQLQRTRDTNKSLTEANRALLGAKQSEAPTVDKAEFEQLQGKVRELTAAGEELRQQNQKLATDNQDLLAAHTLLQQQLGEARKSATALSALGGEKAALQERLEAVGTQLIKAQQEVDTLQKENADATSRALASKEAAEKAQAELAALQGRATDAEKTAESHNAAVAELTEANGKLETERNDLRRQLATLKADNARLAQSAGSLEQLKADADRSAQQNITALTAQLGQTQRDLQGAREANARLVEGHVAQERDRTAVINQLRNENAALMARLTQAQGTLDQIASAARLGTPASTIATGGMAPGRPVLATPAGGGEVRIHTVAEGDSLSRISMRYYGTANRWQEVYNANRDVLQGSNTLRVGMQLRIP